MTLFCRRTHFIPTGYIEDTPEAIAKQPKADIPSNFSAPKDINLMSYCTPVDNQEKNPWCAAFSVAKVIEIHNWKITHVQTEIDPGPIYAEAKRIDCIPSQGTTLSFAFQAAVNIKLISERARLINVGSVDNMRFCIHRYGPLLMGFKATKGWNECNLINGKIGNSDVQIGGHAVVCCYFNDYDGEVAGPNSWGTKWGWKNGYWNMTWDQCRNQYRDSKAIDWTDVIY